jgi:quercetin dioxygenase-like cupin family protein
MQARKSARKLLLAIGLAVAIVVVVFGLSARVLHAQVPGFKRVELQRHDLSYAGHEAMMARGDFNPGVGIPKHSHPGEEVAYILEGTIVLEIEGKPPATLKAGDVFFVPAGTIHAVKNTGSTPAKILSTYVVEKGKPLATLVK